MRRLRGYIFLLAGVSNHCLERTGPQTDMHQLPGEARYDDDVEKIPDHNTDVDCAEHSGISSLDADYLARTARNDIRKSTFGAMSKLRSDPLSIPFNERYVAISYAEGTTKERNNRQFFHHILQLGGRKTGYRSLRLSTYPARMSSHSKSVLAGVETVTDLSRTRKTWRCS